MMKNLENLYLSAAYLLNDSYVLFYKKEYPQAHIMAAARHGLKSACLRYDPAKGVKFVRYAEFRIHYSIQRCLAEEAPESKLLADRGPSKAVLMAYLKSHQSKTPEDIARENRQIRIDAAKIRQREKTVRQARLYRKWFKSSIQRKDDRYAD